MALQQAMNRLDHIAIIVKRENVESYMQRLTRVLGVQWDEGVTNESAGVYAVPSWDAGIELIAPLRESGRVWERLQKFGEGTVTIVFGVPDIEAAIKRAEDNGAPFLFNIAMIGDEPWLKRFKVFREAKVQVFEDDFASTVTLSQIEPA
jgi:4-hydroxyphenylpyruvate dioxygenase-like putative hemolysin